MTRHPWILVALGIVELLLLGVFGWVRSAHVFPWPGLALFAGAFAVYAAAARHVGKERSSLSLRTVWAIAIGMRLALLPLSPELSDDFNRYLWDGHVQLSGTNPYIYAPDASELDGLRTGFGERVNNPTVPTIYPPFAQVAFLLIALAGSSIVAMKLLWLTCDLATAWVLVRIARDTGRDEGRTLLLYAWAPLLLVEVAMSGHMEPLGLLMMAVAIWASGKHAYRALSGAALALAALVKFAPAAALPVLARRFGWKPLAAFVATIVLLYAPYALAGPGLFTGLLTYSEHWWFMKGLFAFLEWLAQDPLVARRLAAIVVLGVVGWTTWRSFELERALLWILGIGMIVTPTLHPWYVLWMLPMAALRTSRPWILLSGLVFIGYFGLGSYQNTGEWAQPGLARAALWIPFFIALAFDGWRAHRRGGLGEEVLPERG